MMDVASFAKLLFKSLNLLTIIRKYFFFSKVLVLYPDLQFLDSFISDLFLS